MKKQIKNISGMSYMGALRDFKATLKRIPKDFPGYYKAMHEFVDLYATLLNGNIDALEEINKSGDKKTVFNILYNCLSNVLAKGLIRVRDDNQVEINIDLKRVANKLINYAENKENKDELEIILNGGPDKRLFHPEKEYAGTDYLPGFTRLKENVGYFCNPLNDGTFGCAAKDALSITKEYDVEEELKRLVHSIWVVALNTYQLVINKDNPGSFKY